MPDGDPLRPRGRPVPLAEPPVHCPECRAPFAPEALGPHLRQVHRYLFFRGAWRSPAAAADDALAALVAPRPDPDAWRVLADSAAELHGPQAPAALAASLGAALGRVPEAARGAAAETVAAALAAAGAGAPLAVALASAGAAPAHRLALALLARLPPPLDPTLFEPARALLLDRRLPADGQLAAAAVLLRSVPPDDPRTEDVLRFLTSGLGKSGSIDRLRELERRAGRHPAIDAACARLEDRLRMACPRCGAELRRPDMIRHLWEEHRLVLYGRRVRDPWSVVEEWVDLYLRRPDPELLDRCRTLVERADPEQGLSRLYRLLLRRGSADAEARAVLRQEAADAHASLCPACYALVPVPREVPPLAVNQRGGRLWARGYSVEVSERGLRTWLEVRTPAARVYRGREPGRWLTPGGAALALAGPFVLGALVAAAWSDPAVAVRIVSVLLVLASLAYGAALAFWRAEVPRAARARNYAWTLLAPRLHAGRFDPGDAAFLAGLADASGGDGYGFARSGVLPTLAARTERAVLRGEAPPGFLAPLLRLAVEDGAAGGDAVPAAADVLARCFEGALPLAVAERVLADWRADWWRAGNLARLRVLLCDRAFGAGFEVRNLLDLGENSPALAGVLGTSDPHGLAALRLLWSLRAQRPWDRCGDAQTAFELAEDVASAPLLARYPDLLLYQEEPRWQVAADGGDEKMGPARVVLDTGSVRLQGVEFLSTPQPVEVRGKVLGYELWLGEAKFRGPQPLDDLAKRMERWFRFAFHDFLPLTRAAAHWKPPDRAALLRAWGTLPCPECGVRLLPRVGAVGLDPEQAAAP